MCEHEWEQVWFEHVNGAVRLVGPFRCRLCRVLQETEQSVSADAVDPSATDPGKPTPRG